jgi:hypothetical protein
MNKIETGLITLTLAIILILFYSESAAIREEYVVIISIVLGWTAIVNISNGIKGK